MKDEVGDKMMTIFFWLREKCYLTDDGSKDKKVKSTKRVS